jgi:hypothetical protein
MSEPHDTGEPPPEPQPDGQSHEYVVKRVRDLDRKDKIVLEMGDTGWRQSNPLTYDIPPPPAKAVHAAGPAPDPPES